MREVQKRHRTSHKTVIKPCKTSHKPCKTSHKPCKTVLKPVINQSNGRVKPAYGYKPAWDPGYTCVSIPLGSPTRVPKQLYTVVHPSAGCTAVGSTGYGYWVGTGRVLYRPGEYYPATAQGGPRTSGAGPGSPGGWSGWVLGPGACP